VGASVFYSDVSGPESPKRKMGSQSSLEKLDQELKVYTHNFACGDINQNPNGREGIKIQLW